MEFPEKDLADGFYRVEVSGWDAEGIFFVEKSRLEWGDDSDKRTKLRTPLQKGSVIFVRLLQIVSAAGACPSPYEIELLGIDEDGLCEYRLTNVKIRRRKASKTGHEKKLLRATVWSKSE